MGRKSLPTQLKVTRGTLRPDRANAQEPKPAVVLLSPPDWLNERGKEAFTDLSQLLHGQKVLTEMDSMALTLLCDQWSIYRDARDFIAEHGQHCESEDRLGNVIYKNYPQMGTLTATYSNVCRMLTEFGLTPASRPKVKGNDDAQNDPFEEYMNGLG